MNVTVKDKQKDLDSEYQQLTSKKYGLITAQDNLLRAIETDKGTTAIMKRLDSSKDILKMIAQLKMLPQIILATIDYSEYEAEMEFPAKIIILTEKRKLLNEVDYIENQEYIQSMAALLKSQIQ